MTPANMVPNALPYFERTVVYLLATPRLAGAMFGQYILELEPSAHTSRPVPPGFENFFYVLEGEVELNVEETAHPMIQGAFAFVPDHSSFRVKNSRSDRSRLIWVKRRYNAVEGIPAPPSIFNHRSKVEPVETSVARSWRQVLLPLTNPSYDFAMNILSFEPGVYFDQVEIHHQEHGLYMTEGQGIYFLGGSFYEVKKDDYIYMAPYCPQYFFATGWSKSEYLLYKDINRDGF
jgi:(S)-ureidoglycine aminohydrolase